jgi:hypothetical protein
MTMYGIGDSVVQNIHSWGFSFSMFRRRPVGLDFNRFCDRPQMPAEPSPLLRNGQIEPLIL